MVLATVLILCVTYWSLFDDDDKDHNGQNDLCYFYVVVVVLFVMVEICVVSGAHVR